MAQVNSLKTGKKFKKTEIGEIPVDWKIQELKDIADEVYRYPTYYNIEYYENGVPEIRGELIKANGTLNTDLSKYRFIRSATSDKFPRTQLREGDLVLSVRGTMGKVAIVPEFLEGANMTANLIRIAPCRKKIYPAFLLQLLINEKFQNILNVASSSTTIKTIKAPELKSIKFPIPPLPEQKKIAEILTTIDQTIEKSDQVIEKTKELKKGLMQQLLTRGIGHKKFKKTKIGEIPTNWEVMKLRDVAAKQKYAIVDGPFGSNLKSVHYVDKGIPVVQSHFVISGQFKPTEIFYVSEQKAKELERSKVFPGDIVLAKIGVNYGASATVPVDYPEAVLSGNTMKITPNSDIVITEFLQHLLHYFRLTKVFDKIVSTTAQPAITLKGVRDLSIPLPKGSEQKKIAEILTSIDEQIEKENANKEKLEMLKKGLMQVLLTGKVRVRI